MRISDRLKVIQGDITKITVDAIVNAANSSLMGGGGVDGAIHRAGGLKILEECKDIVYKQGGCKVGEAVVTTGGNLPASFVIHTVGPIWKGGNNNEAEQLKSCYLNSLQLAYELGISTIAFPNISTGVYRYPKEQAAKIAIDTVKDFISENNKPDIVTFVCFDDDNYALLQSLLK